MYRTCLRELASVTFPVRHRLSVAPVKRCPTQRSFTTTTPEASQGYAQGSTYNTPYTQDPSYADGVDANAYPSAQTAPPQDRRYIQWTVYKRAAALNIKLIRPRYSTLPDGSYKVEREGDLRLEFAPALQQGQVVEGKNAKYDWGSKQAFHLSAVELSTLLEEPEKKHDLYHDPSKGRGEEGLIVKKLNWSYSSERGLYMVALNVTDKSNGQTKNTNIPVSLTKGEFGVLKNLAPNLIWHMLGFSEVLISVN